MVVVCVCGGGGYKVRFVFALLLCNFLHPKQISVKFCSYEELSRLVLAISLRISALPALSDLICCCQMIWNLGHNFRKELKYWLRKIV